MQQALTTPAVLPTQRNDAAPAIPAKEVTKVALRLKQQIEQVVPCELEEWKITKAHSPILTRAVIATAKQAGGTPYRACVVFALLVVHKWFKRQAQLELWDADLHAVRAVACRRCLLSRIIEQEEDADARLMLEEVLLKRYSHPRRPPRR